MDQSLPRKPSDIVLTLACSRPVGAGSPPGLERWTATATALAPQAPQFAGGQVSVLALDLAVCQDPWGALDGSNEDVAHIGAMVFDEMTVTAH